MPAAQCEMSTISVTLRSKPKPISAKVMKDVKLVLSAVASLLFVATASAQIAANPYAHYDASIVPSITLGTPVNFVPAPYTDAVVGWADQSGNGFNALATGTANGGDRDMVYPGPAGHTFSTGIVGIDTGDTPGNGTALNLLPAGAGQDGLLDFTGAANGKSGFSIYMVYHADALGGSFNANFNYLLGNAAFPNNVGPGIWMNSSGFVWADINGGGAAFAGFIPAGGESVISFNYDSSSGNWAIANTGSGAGSGVGNDAAGDFGSATDFLGLGGSPVWANFRTDGDFGEVIIYDRFIDPASQEHLDTLSALNTKWLVPEPSTLALVGMGLAALVVRRRIRS